MTRFNQYAVSSPPGGVRTPVPCRRIRKRDGEDERRHPVRCPSRVVGKELGADAQPVRCGERALLRLQKHRLADGMDALGEDDRHRSGTRALTDAPAGLAERLEGGGLGSRVPVHACCRIHIDRISRNGPGGLRRECPRAKY